MAKLEDVSVDELHEVLESVNDKKAVQRLMLAILYKQGPSVPMLAEWFDMRERTIYDWFDCLESEPLGEAVHDAPRPGRPPKLTESQRAAFEGALEDDPAEYGIDAATWSPEAAREFLETEFGVEYTSRHVQRLLNDAGVSW